MLFFLVGCASAYGFHNYLTFSIRQVYPEIDVSLAPRDGSLMLRWGVSVVSDGAECAEISAAVPDSSAYAVSLASNERVTPDEHFQDVRFLKMKCNDEGRVFSYEPGDVAYITPCNSPEAVDKFFSLFEENGFHRSTKLRLEQLHRGVSVPVQLLNKSFLLEDCVRNYWDLNAIPTRSLFEVMASVSTEELERDKLLELSSPEGTQELYDYCNRPRRTVLEVLADFPHSRSHLKLDHMFDLLRSIRPRAFSIASSPLEVELKLLVAVVKYRTRLKAPRLGLCSNWLKDLPVGAQLSVSIRKGSLRFPPSSSNISESSKVPVVMVGPGTGVAPFRSYIMTEHLTRPPDLRRPLILFFGCRNKEADFFFNKEWPLVDNLIVFTAFSRDQPHKIYVQHVIVEQKELVATQLLANGGYLFVAGSSKDMPDSVRDAMRKCLIDVGRISEAEAENILEKMSSDNRYQQEVWG